MRNVKVVVFGLGRKYTAQSDQNGWFRTNVPKPGRYLVRIFLPSYSDVVGTGPELAKINRRVRTRAHTVLDYEVDVKAGSCTFVDPPVFIPYSEFEKQKGD